jgi:tetratricopeptide (TPR) repeat protein
MARRILVATIIAVTVTLLQTPLAQAQWTGTGRISGTVTDRDGQPIVGARVTYRLAEKPDAGPEPFITDENGQFSFAGMKSATWILKIEAEGFLPIPPQKTFVYATMNDPIRIQMEPIPEEALRAQKRAETNKILMKGDELRAKGKTKEAREEYLKAIGDLDEEQKPIVLAALADTYLDEGNVEKATEQLNKALAINPNHVPSLVGMMAILTDQGKIDEVEELLTRVPEDEEVPSVILLRLAKEYYDRDDMGKTKTLLDRVLNDNPDEAIAYYMRALTELNLNELDNARADIERFLELAPEDPQAGAARDILTYLPPPAEPAEPAEEEGGEK